MADIFNPWPKLLESLSDPNVFRTPPIVPESSQPTAATPPPAASATQPKTGSSKLDKLMMFLVPAASGFIASQFGRRRDRTRNFLAGATQGGLGVLQDVTTRGARQKAAQQAALEAAIKEKRAAEKHKLDMDKGTTELENLRKPKVEKPKYTTQERKNADGSTTLYRIDEQGNASPVTTEEATRIGSAPISGPLFGTQQEQQGTVTRRVPFGSAPPPKKAEESKPVSRYDRRSGKSVFVEGNPALPNFGEVIKSTKTGTPEPREPSAGDERKKREADLSRYVDNAIEAARREVPNFDKLEPEEQINAIQDIARDATQDDPENLRPLLQDALRQIDAIWRRRRPPKQGTRYNDPRKAAGVQ